MDWHFLLTLNYGLIPRTFLYNPFDLRAFPSHIERPLFPKSTPHKYESFANNALYYGFNTAKVGAAVGIFCLAVTITERLARWVYRHVRGSIQYWKDEITDLKNGGMDSDQIALEKDGLVNDREGWESPVIEKRSRYIKWSTVY
jgi:hypothetical protein